MRAVLTIAATALGNDTLAAAVVDRTGNILGVYTRTGADERTPDIAVSVARAGAHVRQRPGAAVVAHGPLHQRHPFPRRASRTPRNAALYGVENINRGCRVDVQGDAVFNAAVPAAEVDRGHRSAKAPATTPLPCEPSDTRGCARGGPMLDDEGQPLAVGRASPPARPTCSTPARTSRDAVPVNPGGIPIYRGGKVVGGVGVAGVRAGLRGIRGDAAAAGAGRGLDFSEPLGTPGAVFIDGLRLPFFGTCTNITCIRKTLRGAPAGIGAGARVERHVSRSSRATACRRPRTTSSGRAASTRRRAASRADEVRRIVDQSVAVAFKTRAMIRLPINQPTRMTIGISDESGAILALYRMADGTVFSSDVAMTKARNAYYFSTREGYEVLRDVAAQQHRTIATPGRPSRPPARAGR